MGRPASVVCGRGCLPPDARQAVDSDYRTPPRNGWPVAIIDMHAHVFPDALAMRVMPGMEREAGVRATYDGTLAGLLSVMDRAGIDVTVTQPVATRPEQVPTINEWAATTASERIVPFGALHPDTPDPRAQAARIRELGMRGIKLHPEFQACAPDDPRMDALCEAAAEHDLIVLFHAGADLAVPTRLGSPASFARLLDRHPGLTAVLAHMGGWDMWDEVAEHLLGREIYLDTSYARGYLAEDTFLRMVREHGVDRVLFGTDGPWADAADEVGWITSLGLTPAETAAIMHDNARALLDRHA